MNNAFDLIAFNIELPWCLNGMTGAPAFAGR